MDKKVAVIGAGSWGTAIAFVLADNGHETMLWARREEQVVEVNQHSTNQRYLPDVSLPQTLRATSSLEEAVNGADMIVLAVPTVAIREVARDIASYLDEPQLFVHVSKGIEPGSLKRISEMMEEEIPASKRRAIVALSGPSHAEEVVKRQPTTVTAASIDHTAAKAVQDFFMNNYFRVYTNEDIVGVDLGGRRIIKKALGAGATDGIGYGDNAKAALITRGLAEITRLGVAMGAHPLTFSGLSGLGDLIVTCTSEHSRNCRAGNRLGQGQTLEEVTEGMGMVIEGVRTTKAAFELAEKYNVSMPITSAIYHVLFREVTPKEAVDRLMERDKKEEVTGILEKKG